MTTTSKVPDIGLVHPGAHALNLHPPDLIPMCSSLRSKPSTPRYTLNPTPEPETFRALNSGADASELSFRDASGDDVAFKLSREGPLEAPRVSLVHALGSAFWRLGFRSLRLG